MAHAARRNAGRRALARPLWNLTNETLHPLARRFVRRLGPGIVNDLLHWAHEADPDATLVFNEWTVEVFTGFPAPAAADVRDRVLELRAAGVPVHARFRVEPGPDPLTVALVAP